MPRGKSKRLTKDNILEKEIFKTIKKSKNHMLNTRQIHLEIKLNVSYPTLKKYLENMVYEKKIKKYEFGKTIVLWSQ